MLNSATDEQLRLAARLYYLDGLGQTEVAKFAKVSQAKVSRLLSLARDRGIVRISVAEYDPRRADLEQQILATYKLRSAAVIKTVEGAAPDQVRRMVGHFGADYVLSLLPRSGVVAIAGGRTIREVIQPMREDKSRCLTVIQAMGSIDYTVGPVDALELGRTLAQRTGGFFLTLNTPAFVSDKRTRDAFMGQHQIRSFWQRLKQAEAALVGIGTLENSVFVDRQVLSAADLCELSQHGAVGEICGRFYDRHGRECDSPWRDRVLSVELDLLRRMPQVIGVVSGADRAAAIAAAIRGGLLKSLVMDEAVANALLAIATFPPAPQVKGSKK